MGPLRCVRCGFVFEVGTRAGLVSRDMGAPEVDHRFVLLDSMRDDHRRSDQQLVSWQRGYFIGVLFGCFGRQIDGLGFQSSIRAIYFHLCLRISASVEPCTAIVAQAWDPSLVAKAIS